MGTAIDIFLQRATTFARTFPEATLVMPAPELAVDDMARAHHYRSTCELVRARMIATAKLALRGQSPAASDLFDHEHHGDTV